MTTRVKVVCASVKQNFHGNNKTSFEYEFHAVYANSNENREFWEATPTGNLKFQCVKDTAPRFEVGKEYFLDLTSAIAESVGA